MAGAERRAGLDPQANDVRRPAPQIVSAEDEEAAGPHRRQAGK